MGPGPLSHLCQRAAEEVRRLVEARSHEQAPVRGPLEGQLVGPAVATADEVLGTRLKGGEA